MLSSFLICLCFTVLIYVDCRRHDIDLVTFALFMSIPYFGIWPIFILSSQSYQPTSDNSVALINIIIFMSYLLLWMINKLIKRKGNKTYQNFVDMELFLKKIERLRLSYIVCFVLFILIFTAYGFLKLEILKSFDMQAFADGRVKLPSWYLAVFASKRFFVLFAVIALYVKFLKSRSNRILINFCLLVMIIISVMYGRAFIITIITSCFFIFLKIRRKSFLSVKIFPWIVISSVFLLVSLNFFQHMRSVLIAPTLFSTGSNAKTQFYHKLDSLKIKQLFEIESIHDSLVTRPSVWRFNEMIYTWQFINPSVNTLPNGELLVYSWASIVPRTIWNDKPPNNIQKYKLFPFYQKSYNKFQAPSILGYTFADFSILCIFVFPILMILMFYVTAFIQKLFSKHDWWVFMLSSGAIYNVLSLEANYDSYILIIRNSIFFGLVFCSPSMLKALLRK